MRDGGKYRDTHPARCHFARVTLLWREHRKAACACELYHGCFSIPKEDQIRIDIGSQRSRSAEGIGFTAGSFSEDVRCAITAIRDWDACNQIAWPDGAPGGGDCLCDQRGIRATFVAVWGNQDVHLVASLHLYGMKMAKINVVLAHIFSISYTSINEEGGCYDGCCLVGCTGWTA